jgi:hypothetical protein
MIALFLGLHSIFGRDDLFVVPPLIFPLSQVKS